MPSTIVSPQTTTHSRSISSSSSIATSTKRPVPSSSSPISTKQQQLLHRPRHSHSISYASQQRHSPSHPHPLSHSNSHPHSQQRHARVPGSSGGGGGDIATTTVVVVAEDVNELEEEYMVETSLTSPGDKVKEMERHRAREGHKAQKEKEKARRSHRKSGARRSQDFHLASASAVRNGSYPTDVDMDMDMDVDADMDVDELAGDETPLLPSSSSGTHIEGFTSKQLSPVGLLSFTELPNPLGSQRLPLSDSFANGSSATPPSVYASQEIPRGCPLVVPNPQPPRDSSVELPPPPASQPMFAYNASSREEETERARLTTACEALSSLCSQWHGSEYNRLKWGHHGSPATYCPLSIFAPQHVAAIMQAQAVYEGQLFSTSEKESGSEVDADAADEVVDAESGEDSSDTSGGAAKEPLTPGSSWIWESLVQIVGEDGTLQQSTPQPGQGKQKQKQKSKSEPRLKSLQAEEGLEGPAAPDSKVHVQSVNPEHTERLLSQQREDHYERIARNVQEAMNEPISTSPTKQQQQQQQHQQQQQQQQQQQRQPKHSVKTSQTHPINISFFLPNELLPHLPNMISTASQILPHDPRSGKPLAFPTTQDLLEVAMSDSSPLGAYGSGPIPLTSIDGSIESFGVGNLFLSSCPGKKVRLEGPVRGRGAICRDLKADLARMRALGVGCIICCLDDNELQYLGAPWEEYSRSASEVGLDVVRIPMPEGLTPASLQAFDSRLEKVLRRYTLKGIHVLTHCRGGVGRAGLTACAWAVKLGFMGPAPEMEQHLATMAANGMSPEEQENCRVMSTVERVICLIRRRRSVKAIETFEQVNFLVSYVRWLRKESGLAQTALSV